MLCTVLLESSQLSSLPTSPHLTLPHLGTLEYYHPFFILQEVVIPTWILFDSHHFHRSPLQLQDGIVVLDSVNGSEFDGHIFR